MTDTNSGAVNLDPLADDRPNPADIPGNTEEQRKAAKKCADWFADDKSAKQDYVNEMAENDKLYAGKHWDLTSTTGAQLRTVDQQFTHPNNVENVAMSLVAGEMSELMQDVELTDFPGDEDDDEVALQMTDLKKAISYRNRIAEERLDWGWNYVGHGTGIWEHVWDPTWKGGRGPNRWVGEVRWRSVHPRAIFPDARCGKDVHRSRRLHKAIYVTLEYLREKYPDFGGLATEEVTDPTLLTSDTKMPAEALAGQTLLVETWYVGQPLFPDDSGRKDSGLHVIWWCGEGTPVYLKHANYLYFGVDEEPRLPFTFRKRYPRDNSPWGYGTYWFAKNPQIMLNKTAEMVMEAHMHAINGQTFYEANAVGEDEEADIKRYGMQPGRWFKVTDPKGIMRLYGQGVPGSALSELQRYPRVMEYLVGRFDVSQGRAPGSVTAFRALELLAQRAQVRLRSADTQIQSAYEDCGQYINRLITGNYTEARAYRIIGMDDSTGKPNIKRGVFQLDKVLKVWNKGSNVVQRLNEFQALPGMVEGTDYEIYDPELDVRCRTTSATPSDRVFYMEVAKELYQAKAIDLETFYYVLEHGKFPPYELVLQRMTQQQGMTPSQPGQPPVPGAQLSPEAQALLDAVPSELQAQLAQLPPEILEQLVNTPPEKVAELMQPIVSQQSQLANTGGLITAIAVRPQPGQSVSA